MKFLYLALGGSIGAILRYLFTMFSIRFFPHGIFTGTMIVNVIGSFLIGFAFVLLGREQISPNLKILLFVGIFGSFTTFSTFMFETWDLYKEGTFKMAAIYLSLSSVLGLLAVYSGFLIAELIEKQIK